MGAVGKEGALRAVVVPTLITTAVMIAFAFFLFQALARTRLADDVHGGYGGLGSGVAVGIMTSIATRRAKAS